MAKQPNTTKDNKCLKNFKRCETEHFRSYALMKRLDYAQDLALMKKASDKKHNSTKYSALQSIDVHWFFIERTEICQLSWIGRSDEHLA